VRHPERILLVEDNDQNRELFEFLLEEAGYEIVSAPDAVSAREAFNAELPDLVLMDMSLPGIHGLDLVREIRGLPGGSDVPVIAVTALAMRGDKEKFLAGGCDGYIAKPIEPAAFVSEVERFLPPDPSGARAV